MIGFEEQLDLFKLIGETLKKEIHCYAIGGSAMPFYGSKSATKDVDLVFESGEERKALGKTLLSLGFKKPEEKIYTRFKDVMREKPVLLERNDVRFDLFYKDIISFQLSEGIKERAREKHEFSNFVLYVVSPEDIILLKSTTDRKGDRKDAEGLIQKFNVDWDVIIEECRQQTKKGRKVFSVFLYDFLAELKEDFDVEIPKEVIKKIRYIGEKEMLKALKKREKSDL